MTFAPGGKITALLLHWLRLGKNAEKKNDVMHEDELHGVPTRVRE